MNLDYLRTYVEVVKRRSFSEAAKRLGITQPAVSFQMRRLEGDLGIRLLERGQKTISMTDAGKRLFAFAELIEQQRVTLMNDLEQLRHDVTGTIIIGASTIPGEILLPPVLGEFKALHPNIGAHVVISDSINVITKVKEGDYDVGFCGIAPEGKDLDYFKIAEDEIVLIVFPEHPLAQKEHISFLDLEGESLILREETSGTQQNLKSLLTSAGFDISKWVPDLVLGTTQAVVSAVESRAGIAFVSNLAIKKSVALGLVKEVLVNGLKLNRNFYCIYRRERVVSRLLGEFISFAQSRAVQD
ncbi:MAG: selenium metabolism-associated LysR family transcriptional regulator [Chloroflexota bacterium]|nr:selenium metabolism-associated LysR family transcriptional regulator [Chloroflexota bacterium]